MIYGSLEELEFNYPYLHSDSRPEKFKLFIIGKDEGERLKACDFTKKVLEEMFESAKEERKIKGYEVCVLNLALDKNPDYMEPTSQFWRRIGNQEGVIFVPIFHNPGSSSNLPQLAFDLNKPG